MEFSASYYKRNEKMASLIVPSLTETSEALGEDISSLLFSSCPESLRSEMSVDSKLVGPGQVLWISPSDILINNVVLKPPLTNKYMRALTHEGILEIGYRVERHFIAEMEAQQNNLIQEQAQLMRYVAHREKEEAIEETRLQERHKFQQDLMQLNEEFEMLLGEELTKLELYLKLMYEELLEEQIAEVLEKEAVKTQELIDEAVERTVENLTNKFLEDMKIQNEQLTALFEKKLEVQKASYVELLGNEQEVFKIILKQLQHNLQCNSIANFMYLLCTERRKCLYEQRNLVEKYEKQISELRAIGADLQSKLAKVIAERNLKERQCTIRETCLRSVIRQFQKFINFALRATPTQAEFLLSVEKMMMFELTQAVAKAASHDKTRKLKQFMPWRSVSRTAHSSRKDMIAKDYHNCLKETAMPTLRESQQSLPYLHYNSRPYVREDFRNKISRGLFVRPSSMIWNKEVENLINIMKSSISSTHFSPRQTNQSSIQFKHNKDNSETCTATIFNPENMNVGLLATQDSLTIQKRVSSVYATVGRGSDNDSGGNVGILATSDSLTLVRNASVRGNLRRSSEVKCEQNLKLEKGATRSKTSALEDIHMESQARASSFSRVSNDTIYLGFRKKYTGSKKSSKDPSIGSAFLKEFEHETETKPPIKTGSRKNLCHKSLSCDQKLDGAKDGGALQPRHSILASEKCVGPIREINRPSDVEKNLNEYMRKSVSEERQGQYIINTPAVEKTLNVNFMEVASVFQNLVEPGKPDNIYNTKNNTAIKSLPSRDNYLEKPNEAKVIGIRQQDVDDTTQNFTIHRIHSIVDMLKRDDDLIHIFTGCSQ